MDAEDSVPCGETATLIVSVKTIKLSFISVGKIESHLAESCGTHNLWKLEQKSHRTDGSIDDNLSYYSILYDLSIFSEDMCLTGSNLTRYFEIKCGDIY